MESPSMKTSCNPILCAICNFADIGFASYSSSRDGHTHWVMDILPYPIQMFWVIPGSLWVELNWVGYGYYPNSSGRVWILSIPDPYIY